MPTPPAEHLETLYTISLAIGLSLDLRPMLTHSLSAFKTHLHCSAAGVGLWRAEGDQRQRLEALYSVPENIDDNAAYQAALWCVPPSLTGEHFSEFHRRLPLSGGDPPHGYFHVLELPRVGVLILTCPDANLPPTLIEALPPLLYKLARACKACAQNSYLIEAAKVVSSTLTVQHVLNRILQQLERVVVMDEAIISLHSDGQLTLAAGWNIHGRPIAPFTIIAKEYPLNALALRDGRPILVSDVTQDDRWRSGPIMAAMRSFINAPLLIQDHPIGLLSVGRSDAAPYTEEDAHIVFAFATQVAIAVENARLAERTQAALQETEGLFLAAREILGATTLTEVCQTLTRHFKQLVQAHRMAIYLVDHHQRDIILAMYDGLAVGDETEITYALLEQGLSGMVFQTRQPVLSIHADDGIEPEATRERRKAFGTGAVIVVPLLARGRLIGTATAINRADQRAFTHHDVDVLMALATHAATAIENVRLLDTTEQQLTELQAKNAELDAFAHTVAHDLKNPLGVILGYAAVLADETRPVTSGEQTLAHNAILRYSQKMNSIIEGLMLLAGVRKMDQANVGVVTMGDIVTEALERLSGLIKERQAVIHLPSQWPTVLGYAPWLEEVWVNYLSNALKYGGRPPHLELGATEGAEWKNGQIKEAAHYWCFWVRDSGPGLTPEAQTRLFVPFERLDQVQVKGHGLGLSIVRRIIEKLGGQVGVESQPEQGCTFFFTLPKA